MNTGKRALSSTASETSINTSLLETSVFEKGETTTKTTESSNQTKNTKNKTKPDPKKQKTMTTFVTSAQNVNHETCVITIEQRLDEISDKLSHVLTKGDSTFIK